MNFRLSFSRLAGIVCSFSSLGFCQPVITSFTQSGILVCSQLAPGSVATVEGSSSVGAGTTWEDLQSGTVAQDGTVQIPVPVSGATAPKFYRVRGTG